MGLVSESGWLSELELGSRVDSGLGSCWGLWSVLGVVGRFVGQMVRWSVGSAIAWPVGGGLVGVGRLAGRSADRLTGRLGRAYCSVSWLVGYSVGRLLGRWVGRLVSVGWCWSVGRSHGWLAGRSALGLVGWLAEVGRWVGLTSWDRFTDWG